MFEREPAGSSFQSYLAEVVGRRPEGLVRLWKAAGLALAGTAGLCTFLLDKSPPPLFNAPTALAAALLFLYGARPVCDSMIYSILPVGAIRSADWRNELTSGTIRAYGLPIGLWLSTLPRVMAYSLVLLCVWAVPLPALARAFMTVAFGYPALTFVVSSLMPSRPTSEAWSFQHGYLREWHKALRGQPDAKSPGTLGGVSIPPHYPTGRAFTAMKVARKAIAAAWWSAVLYVFWLVSVAAGWPSEPLHLGWAAALLGAFISAQLVVNVAFDRSLEFLEQIRYESIAGELTPDKARDYHDAVEELRRQRLYPSRRQLPTFYGIPLPREAQQSESV